MKRTLLLVPLLCISTGVFAKVSYEDALESARPYEEATAAMHNPPDTEGLSEGEVPDGNQNDFGHWKKLSSRPTASSFVRLVGSSTGYECAPKGTYGIEAYEWCDGSNAGNTTCHTNEAYYHCE